MPKIMQEERAHLALCRSHSCFLFSFPISIGWSVSLLS